MYQAMQASGQVWDVIYQKLGQMAKWVSTIHQGCDLSNPGSPLAHPALQICWCATKHAGNYLALSPHMHDQA